MIKKFLALFLMGSFSLVSAQSLEKTTLWKITGNGIEQPSYLFGTIHMSCSVNITPAIQKALDDTKQLYLELDMDDKDLQLKVMEGLMINGGKSYGDFLSPDEMSQLDAFLKKNAGMGIDVAKTMKPLVLSMALLPKMANCPLKSYEQELLKITAQQREEVWGLEEYTDQLEAFNAIPMEDQVKELMKTVKDGMKKAKAEFQSMMAIYDAGDIELLLKMTQQSEASEAFSKHSAIMLDKRNMKWIPKITEAASKTPTFFGVGAAHLAGENGVINLLRKEGYRVEPVKVK